MENGIPKHCNKRAKKFFKWGSRYNGKNESGYRYSTTHEELEPTRTASIDGKEYCIYCGNPAYSIQANINRFNNYDVTGHCCICKNAMDEIDYRKEKEELQTKHYEEKEELDEKYNQISGLKN
jgi:hypothetical protein